MVLTPGLLRRAKSTDQPYLAGYDPAAFVTAGYSVPFGTDWSGYADTTAVLAAVSFASSSGSALPAGAYITKVNDDPIFPNRMIESLMPYNNDFTTTSPGSHGRQFLKNVSVPASTPRIICRYVSRHGGTLHPTRPSPSNYSHDGDYPLLSPPSADSVKLFYFEFSGGPYSGGRVGIQYSTITNLFVDQGFGTGIVTDGGVTVLEAGYTDWFTVPSEAALFTGQDVYEYTHEYYRVSDDLVIYRRWRQQLTLSGTWNPQLPVFIGRVHTRVSGAVMPYTTQVRFHDNKNNTTKSDGLSDTDWDSPSLHTPGAFASSNSEAGPLRAESDKPFRGARRYYGPILYVYGGDDAPFDDHLGRNMDEYGRADANWPVGA